MLLLLSYAIAATFETQDAKDRTVQKLTEKSNEAARIVQEIYFKLCNAQSSEIFVDNEIRNFDRLISETDRKLDDLYVKKQVKEYHDVVLERQQLIACQQKERAKKVSIERKCVELKRLHEKVSKDFLNIQQQRDEALNESIKS